jgi:predicted aconitase with swiveling domain
MKLIVKEKIDVMKKRLSTLAKIDPEEAQIKEDEQDAAQEAIAGIEEAWKSILEEYDFSE